MMNRTWKLSKRPNVLKLDEKRQPASKTTKYNKKGE
jgi:hypothetical protein